MVVAKLKDAGGFAGGLLLVVALIALPVIFLMGAAEFSVWALHWIPSVIGIAMLICLLLVPFAIIPATRGFSAQLFGLISFVFGTSLWLYALAFTYAKWGLFGVVIGVMLFGAGVIAVGTLAAILSGTWMVLGNLAFLFGLFIVTRIASVWLSNLSEQRTLRRAMQENPSTAVIIAPHRLDSAD